MKGKPWGPQSRKKRARSRAERAKKARGLRVGGLWIPPLVSQRLREAEITSKDSDEIKLVVKAALAILAREDGIFEDVTAEEYINRACGGMLIEAEVQGQVARWRKLHGKNTPEHQARLHVLALYPRYVGMILEEQKRWTTVAHAVRDLAEANGAHFAPDGGTRKRVTASRRKGRK